MAHVSCVLPHSGQVKEEITLAIFVAVGERQFSPTAANTSRHKNDKLIFTI